MREIKFRAWEKTLKEIIPVYNIDFKNEIINKGSVWRFFSEIVLMRYTGLSDKNGREIYEGDFLYFDVFDGLVNVSGTTQVYFADGCFRLNEHHPVADYIRNGTVEVVGNIYEGVDADE